MAMIELPKVRADGKFVLTGIEHTEIKGMEPCQIQFGHKLYQGTKIYGPFGKFKVVLPPTTLMAMKAAALKNPEAIIRLSESKIQTLPMAYNATDKVAGPQGTKALSSGQKMIGNGKTPEQSKAHETYTTNQAIADMANYIKSQRKSK